MTTFKLNTKNEEKWNTLSHGVGAIFSFVALVLLVVYASLNGDTLEIICATVFGVSLLLLYLASTFYHGSKDEQTRKKLKLADHLCIYLLIAGTYTPVTLLGLKGAWGWTIFGLVWGLAFLGFLFKLSRFRTLEKVSLLLYAVMGWLIIIALKPLLLQLSTEALVYLGSGGLCYTIGIYFFVNEKLSFNHLIWHLFVLAGSVFHFLGIFLYILP